MLTQQVSRCVDLRSSWFSQIEPMVKISLAGNKPPTSSTLWVSSCSKGRADPRPKPCRRAICRGKTGTRRPSALIAPLPRYTFHKMLKQSLDEERGSPGVGNDQGNQRFRRLLSAESSDPLAHCRLRKTSKQHLIDCMSSNHFVDELGQRTGRIQIFVSVRPNAPCQMGERR